jgi:hypothetical protein
MLRTNPGSWLFDATWPVLAVMTLGVVNYELWASGEGWGRWLVRVMFLFVTVGSFFVVFVDI